METKNPKMPSKLIKTDKLIQNATQDTIMICDEIEIEGVSDYHGDKENWYIP